MGDFIYKIKDFGVFDIIVNKINQGKREKKMDLISYKRIETQNGDNQIVWVCFLPWRMHFEEAEKLGLIPKKGRIICYTGPIGLANLDPNISKQLLLSLVNDIKSLNLQSFNVLALSIGNYPGFYVANHFNVNKLVSVVPGSYLGGAIFDGIATKHIKRDSMAYGIENGKKYDFIIKGTNPIENLDNLNFDIEIHLASHDLFIPTFYGNMLIEEIKKKNKNLKVINYTGKGHVLTVLKFGKDNPY
ncbi:MAG: hypothetical protein WC850_00770 [Candidatus Gracilibacteria bacterium]